MNSVQERLAKLGMGVNDAGLTEEQSFRNDAGQAVYTGAALPDAPPISLTSEINKLEAADAAGGGGSPQAQSMDGLISSPEIQFQEEELFETTHSDPEKAMNGEDEVVGISGMVPVKLNKEQQALYDADENELDNLQKRLSLSEAGNSSTASGSFNLMSAYNKKSPEEVEQMKARINELQKSMHGRKYDKDFSNKEAAGQEFKDEYNQNEFNKYQNNMNGNFGEEVEVVPTGTGDKKYDKENYDLSNAYVVTPLTFDGAKVYMKNKGIDTINDPTTAMIAAFEGPHGDSTGKAETTYYGMQTKEYNALKKQKEYSKMSNEQLFDVMIVNKRNDVRRAHDKKFGPGSFDDLNPTAKSVMVMARYRGDYNSGYKWPKLIQEGNYSAAADEIMRADDARDSKKEKEAGVLKRFYTYYRLLKSIQPAEQ